LRFLLLGPCPEFLNVLGWVAAHVADPDGYAIPHADYTHLADGVLLKVFPHKINGVIERQQIAVGQQVFLGHGKAHVEDQHQVPYDAAL
jgi:hypothetical protein